MSKMADMAEIFLFIKVSSPSFCQNHVIALGDPFWEYIHAISIVVVVMAVASVLMVGVVAVAIVIISSTINILIIVVVGYSSNVTHLS